MRQSQYNVADLRVSDHRPVFALFDCLVDVIDHTLKDSLRRTLYEQKQRDALSDSIHLLDLDDDDTMSQDSVSIAPGLPPASSDRSKWWLDNGELSTFLFNLCFPFCSSSACSLFIIR